MTNSQSVELHNAHVSEYDVEVLFGSLQRDYDLHPITPEEWEEMNSNNCPF